MRKVSPNIVVLDRGNDTTCTVNLHGATVVSWIINGVEQLFVSKLAVFNGREPIRGGVAVIFPHHGSWPFGPRHGFARIITWTLERAPYKLKSGDIEAIFSLNESEFTRSMWNFPFRLVYTLELHEKELHFAITLQNTSKKLPFRFMLSLNNYLMVPDVTQCEMLELQGCSYIEQGDDETHKNEEVAFKIDQHRSIVFTDTPNEFFITNAMSGHKVRIEKKNFPDIAVWNPRNEGNRTIRDLSDDEYVKFFYFGTGVVHKLVPLGPGDSFEGRMVLSSCRKVSVGND